LRIADEITKPGMSRVEELSIAVRLLLRRTKQKTFLNS
jgi:hypothetical protein